MSLNNILLLDYVWIQTFEICFSLFNVFFQHFTFSTFTSLSMLPSFWLLLIVLFIWLMFLYGVWDFFSFKFAKLITICELVTTLLYKYCGTSLLINDCCTQIEPFLFTLCIIRRGKGKKSCFLENYIRKNFWDITMKLQLK